jgi:hypothetical protein
MKSSLFPPFRQCSESVSPLSYGVLALLKERKLSLEGRLLRRGHRTSGGTELSEDTDIT